MGSRTTRLLVSMLVVIGAGCCASEAWALEPPRMKMTTEVPPGIPGKGWNTILRLYGPLESFYDRSWRPGDPELIE